MVNFPASERKRPMGTTVGSGTKATSANWKIGKGRVRNLLLMGPDVSGKRKSRSRTSAWGDFDNEKKFVYFTGPGNACQIRSLRSKLSLAGNNSSLIRITAKMAVPAISSVNHPLCYPIFLERQGQSISSQPPLNDSVDKDGGFRPDPCSPLVVQKSIEDKMLYTYERQRIVDLCNAYAYTLDSTMMDLKVAEEWANLFTEDCVVTYPFGTHIGRDGLSTFGMKAESRFKRMVHVATNFTVIFESDDIAHARYTCFATHGLHESDVSQHFMEGGYYYSSFRRIKGDRGDQWKFTNLTLDMMWTLGESLGLNEPHKP